MFEFLKKKKKEWKEGIPETPEESKAGKEEFKDEEIPDLPQEFRDEEEHKKEIAPVLPLPTDEEAKIAQPSKAVLTGKGIKGPVFLSFKRYNEVKNNLGNLKDSATELKMIIGDLKINKNTGSDLLKELTDNLERIEDKINKINSTLRA